MCPVRSTTGVSSDKRQGRDQRWYHVVTREREGICPRRNGTITTYDVNGTGRDLSGRYCRQRRSDRILHHGNDDSGFVRGRDGTIVTFDGQDAYFTGGTAIDGRGTVVGEYDASGSEHGFLRSKTGKITVIDVPNEALTYPAAINEAGVVTGGCYDGSGFHGFIRTP